MPEKMKVCEACALTGFSDKIHRGIFAMEPRDKICNECGGRGWVPDEDKVDDRTPSS